MTIRSLHWLREDAIGDDVHRRALHHPSVPVNPRAFIPPAFLGLGIDTHRHGVELIAVFEQRSDIGRERGVAAPIAMHDCAIDPNGAVRGDAVELKFEMLAAIGGIDLKMPAIPTETALAIALGDIGILLDRRLGGPIVREVDRLPIGIIEGLGRRSRSGSSLGACIGDVMPFHLRKRNVSFVEEPALVKGQALAGGFGGAKRHKHGKEEKTTGRGHFYGLGRAVGVSVQE